MYSTKERGTEKQLEMMGDGDSRSFSHSKGCRAVWSGWGMTRGQSQDPERGPWHSAFASAAELQEASEKQLHGPWLPASSPRVKVRAESCSKSTKDKTERDEWGFETCKGAPFPSWSPWRVRWPFWASFLWSGEKSHGREPGSSQGCSHRHPDDAGWQAWGLASPLLISMPSPVKWESCPCAICRVAVQIKWGHIWKHMCTNPNKCKGFLTSLWMGVW